MVNDAKSIGVGRPLPAGIEWNPRHLGWVVIHLASGTGYWRTRTKAVDVGTGSLVISHADDASRLLGSRLADSTFSWFSFNEGDYPGLFSFAEARSLAFLGRGFATVLPAGHAAAMAAAEAFARSSASWDMRRRAEFMSVFCDGISPCMDAVKAKAAAPAMTEARSRLRQWLAQSSGDDLLEGSVVDLAKKLNCSVRHLSRLFVEETGGPLRRRRTDLRMQRAQFLLRDGDRKVLDVALECGYRNLSLFNTLFRKQFGMPPTEWRRRNAPRASSRTTPKTPSWAKAAAVAVIAASLVPWPSSALAREPQAGAAAASPKIGRAHV